MKMNSEIRHYRKQRHSKTCVYFLVITLIIISISLFGAFVVLYKHVTQLRDRVDVLEEKLNEFSKGLINQQDAPKFGKRWQRSSGDDQQKLSAFCQNIEQCNTTTGLTLVYNDDGTNRQKQISGKIKLWRIESQEGSIHYNSASGDVIVLVKGFYHIHAQVRFEQTQTIQDFAAIKITSGSTKAQRVLAASLTNNPNNSLSVTRILSLQKGDQISIEVNDYKYWCSGKIMFFSVVKL